MGRFMVALMAGAALAAVHGGWGAGGPVPGSERLNTGNNAAILSVSCTAPGNCSGGGFVTAKVPDHGALAVLDRAFVVTQRHGAWGQGEVVPGIVKLNKTGLSQVLSVSCASPGNCSAGGSYTDRLGRTRAFVVDERNGTWGGAREVPGAGIVGEPRGSSQLTSVSCPSAGNCAGVGTLSDAKGQHTFVTVEHSGTWRAAFLVPGSEALGTLGAIGFVFMSCPSAGNCTLAGQDGKTLSGTSVFVASEHRGTWRKAINVPGLPALNKGNGAFAFSVSCALAGNCAVGGNYNAGHGVGEAFVADQHNGVWGQAIEVPGIGSLNVSGGAAVMSISCPSAGNCSAGGSYSTVAGLGAFVVSEVHGVWQTAQTVLGRPSMFYSEVLSISCVSAGNCNAGGFDNADGNTVPGEAFAVSEVGGHWGSAVTWSGWRHKEILSISCTRQDQCSAGGLVTINPADFQTFVASKS